MPASYIYYNVVRTGTQVVWLLDFVLGALALVWAMLLRYPSRRAAALALGGAGLLIWSSLWLVAQLGVRLLWTDGVLSAARQLALYVAAVLPYLVVGCTLLAIPAAIGAMLFSRFDRYEGVVADDAAVRIWVGGMRAYGAVALLVVVAAVLSQLMLVLFR